MPSSSIAFTCPGFITLPKYTHTHTYIHKYIHTCIPNIQLALHERISLIGHALLINRFHMSRLDNFAGLRPQQQFSTIEVCEHHSGTTQRLHERDGFLICVCVLERERESFIHNNFRPSRCVTTTVPPPDKWFSDVYMCVRVCVCVCVY